MQNVSAQLLETIEKAYQLLSVLKEQEVSVQPGPGKWSKKEIMGHLIDSASNNHQRFVRAQELGGLTSPGYTQNFWVNSQAYNNEPWMDILSLWYAYNKHLAHVIAQIAPEAEPFICHTGDYEPVTLRFLAEDYIVHMQHHLKEVLK